MVPMINLESPAVLLVCAVGVAVSVALLALWPFPSNLVAMVILAPSLVTGLRSASARVDVALGRRRCRKASARRRRARSAWVEAASD